MRIILNFIIIGLVYYIIYLYFPDFFAQLVAIASKVFSYIHEGFNSLVNWSHQPTAPVPPKV